MSKGGGAGKVYFVLYLAVVLELLIIIVERDEAEEHLRLRQKEAMKIVESILSQMQSGSGTEGMNTRPQDEITIPPPGINIKEVMGADIKSYREYTVEVGVTDVSSAITRRELETEKEYEMRLETLVKLANVEEIQYQLFFNPDENPSNAPPFPSEREIRDRKLDFSGFEPGQTVFVEDVETEWEFLSLTELKLDLTATYNNLNTTNLRATDIKPFYPEDLRKQIGTLYKPEKTPDDSVFYYSPERSVLDRSSGGADLQKRAFVVNFEPPSKAGWYKLRFFSKTNRILGVKGGATSEDISDETTVNIGTVQLSVGDLRQVYRELRMNLDEYDLPDIETFSATQDLDDFLNKIDIAKEEAASKDDAEKIHSRINLYGYICKLLVPGQSINFDQNSGTLEFNVRVITPKPQIAEPVIEQPKYIASFDEVPAVFEFAISPYQGTSNIVSGRVIDENGANIAGLNLTPKDQIAGLDVPMPNNGDKRQYRAVLDKELLPGKYKIELTHQLSGNSRIEEIELDIFETGLTEASETDLNNRLNVFAYYGYPLAFSVTPTSEGKIRTDQFRIYVKTDDNPQNEPYVGTSITFENAITLTPSSKNVSVHVSWVQPYSEEEIVLFEERTVDIAQEPPAINTMRAVYDYSGTATSVRIRVDNIVINPPQSGSKEQQDARVRVDIAGASEKVDGLATYNFAIEPTIEETGDNSYTLYLELSGNLERGQDKVKGTVLVKVRAIAVNPVNGVTSEAITNDVLIPIDYRPEREGPRRRR